MLQKQGIQRDFFDFCPFSFFVLWHQKVNENNARMEGVQSMNICSEKRSKPPTLETQLSKTYTRVVQHRAKFHQSIIDHHCVNRQSSIIHHY